MPPYCWRGAQSHRTPSGDKPPRYFIDASALGSRFPFPYQGTGRLGAQCAHLLRQQRYGEKSANRCKPNKFRECIFSELIRSDYSAR